jgi:dTDP-4-amino-4,6-dideoxygalactose transaminase
VSEFERAFAACHQATFGISATNGTVTLEAALLAAGIGPGDEVIVPPISFIATATAVSRVGATPVFADIHPVSHNLDAERAADAITPRTRAVIPVHFAGHPADMDEFLALARRHHLVLIEDAAHAHGAAWGGRKVGSFGQFGSFSFQQSKTMTAGEGGILLTSDEALADRARSVTNQGRRKGGAWFEHTSLGTNYRLTGWQAAVLLAQLARLPEQLNRRARNAAVLDRQLGDSGIVRPPAVDPRVTVHGYYLYVLRLDGSMPRDLFLRALEAEGIPGACAYPHPLYRNTVFDSLRHRVTDCPEGERFCRECFWVSHEILLADEADLDDFARAVEKIRDASSELAATARH